MHHPVSAAVAAASSHHSIGTPQLKSSTRTGHGQSVLDIVCVALLKYRPVHSISPAYFDAQQHSAGSLASQSSSEPKLETSWISTATRFLSSEPHAAIHFRDPVRRMS
jgi:hypothetical protein